MNNSPMTFCISSYNNLPYLKLAIESVRKYSYFKDSPFVVFSELCDDGTNEWLIENRQKYNLTTLIESNQKLERGDLWMTAAGESGKWEGKNTDNDIYILDDNSFVIDISNKTVHGIGDGMNMCAKIASKKFNTEYLMFLHADFFVSKNWDLEALKIFDKYPNIPMWVSSQRFQPNLFQESSRPGTIVYPYSEFGCTHKDFQEKYFIEYAEEFSKLNPDIEYEKGEGVSGLIRQKDWDYIGGNDPIYAPAYWEDTDIFLRMQLAGYKFVLTSNSVVFHFGSRSGNSNFSTDESITINPNERAVRSEVSLNNERKSGKAFFEKWGFWPTKNHHDFVAIPPHINKSSVEHLIRIKQ